MQNIREFADRVQKAENQISQAIGGIQSHQGISNKTNSCVQDFYDKSRELVASMSNMSDETIRDQIYELEQLADNAKDAVREDSNVSDQDRQRVIDAHNTISNLKHELQH